MQELTEKIRVCEAKLQRAQKLTIALYDEQNRWTQEIKNADDQLQCISADSVYCAAWLIYSGFKNSAERIDIDLIFS